MSERAPPSTGEELTAAADVTSTGHGRRESGDDLLRGDVVGRYVVLAKLGAGGMGVVYVAYDPELDRKVAVKLLHAFVREEATARAQLIREAQALAKLSHPNIVTVHDVGTVGERVWIAMEFVAGQTLREWSRAHRRTWRDVVVHLCAAGRGLVAAHAAGLVHRDFKPDNVMIGDDGRARVMDFGLAMASDAADLGAGAFAGTGRYMAAEQLSGAAGTVRSDQFAFCVTLWEALHGQRPFGDDTFASLVANVLDGNMRAVPRRTAAPAWLRRICARGLARDPGKRWPTMAALIDALERGQVNAGRKRIVAGAMGVALAGAGVVGMRELAERRQIAACEDAGASIREIWNDDTRTALREALIATGVSFASVTADKAMPWLDHQADAWQQARTNVCIEAEVRDERDADALDRALWCLDERRMELDALVTQLRGADVEIVQRAVTAAAAMTAIASCENDRLLARLPPPPLEQRERVREARAEVARAAALGRAGKHAEGLEVARRVLTEAETIAWPPLFASVLAYEAKLLAGMGASEDAARVGAQSYFEAARAGAWDIASASANHLVFVIGSDLAKPAEGDAWARHAEVALAHAGDPAGVREATRLLNVATIRFEIGEYAEAKALIDRALAIQEAALGPVNPDVAKTVGNLAAVYATTADYAKARELFARALAIDEEAYGANHPVVGNVVNNLANVDAATGHYDRARAGYERAKTIWEQAFGPNHPDVATSLVNLGSLAQDIGEYEDARKSFEAAHRIRTSIHAPDHPDIGMSLVNLAGVADMSGDYDRALADYARGLAILETAQGPEHPTVGSTLINIAGVHRKLGGHDKARELFERGLAIREKAFGATHPEVATPLVGLAEVALAQQRFADALVVAERALVLREQGSASPSDIADARFAVARALWESGGDRDRALALATQAHDGWRDGGGKWDAAVRETRAWIDAHPR